jgi:hypothetical protein
VHFGGVGQPRFCAAKNVAGRASASPVTLRRAGSRLMRTVATDPSKNEKKYVSEKF